ncbi:MAG: amidase [Alphaproteobacteria bacterium]|nr:amidase [Alphaproteobacteria bacterium]
MDLAYKSALELQALYRGGKLSPVEATKAALARIDQVNPRLNAFMVVDAERALLAAQRSERRWRMHEPLSPLDGQPVTIKDTLNLQGYPTRSGSRTTPETPVLEDSPEAARLKEAGAIILGKTTTPEFGWKGMTDGPLFGVTRNPWNLERTPGGSSGGAAAALAAGIGTLAVGTDGGGSIRIPASYCGLFGIKPTFGRVPHAPHVGPFSTLVCSGPLARKVADAAAMLDELARPDARDWFALPYDEESFGRDLGKGVKDLRIAFSPNFGEAKVDADVLALAGAAARQFEALGAKVEQVGSIVPALRPGFEKYWLAGFGYTLAQIAPERHALLDPHFLPLAQRGVSVSKEEYFAGHMARVDLGTRLERFFADWDLLLMPTMPVPPPLASTAYHVQGNDRWEHATPFTVPFNYTGQPGASIPCGIGKDGLPVGLQIVGPRFSERLILQAAAAYEAASPMSWPQAAIERNLGR